MTQPHTPLTPAPSASPPTQCGDDHAGAKHAHTAHAATRPAPFIASPITSVLGWPAWLRVLAVLPVLLLLWLAVAWASAEVLPW